MLTFLLPEGSILFGTKCRRSVIVLRHRLNDARRLWRICNEWKWHQAQGVGLICLQVFLFCSSVEHG